MSSASVDAGSFADAACAAFQPPRIAILLCGNFRTFGDPRVYRSIRSNFIDALGGRPTVFIYGKLEAEHLDTVYSRPHAGFVPLSLGERERVVREAAAHLNAHGGPDVVMKITNRSNTAAYNSRCAWQRTNADTHRWANIGQLDSHYQVYRMLEEYETKHSLTFMWVAKLRLDAVWVKSIAPFCTYRPGTAYLAHPMPLDWFFLLPRFVAHAVFRGAYERYQACHGTSFQAFEAKCCGGGITAQVAAEIVHAHVPVVGPPLPVNVPVLGSRQMAGMFLPIVMRDATNNDWCHDFFLYVQTGSHAVSDTRLSLFPDAQLCHLFLDPDVTRLRSRKGMQYKRPSVTLPPPPPPPPPAPPSPPPPPPPPPLPPPRIRLVHPISGDQGKAVSAPAGSSRQSEPPQGRSNAAGVDEATPLAVPTVFRYRRRRSPPPSLEQQSQPSPPSPPPPSSVIATRISGTYGQGVVAARPGTRGYKKANAHVASMSGGWSRSFGRG